MMKRKDVVDDAGGNSGNGGSSGSNDEFTPPTTARLKFLNSLPFRTIFYGEKGLSFVNNIV